MLLPAHVKMARAALGWSLADLANRAHINLNTISRYEGGRDVLSSVVKKLEAVLLAEGCVFFDGINEVGLRLPKEKLPPCK